MDHQSFLLLKEKIINTELVLFVHCCNRLWDKFICSELITKCQILQNQLEMLQKDQAKQQMELKIMENVSNIYLYVHT